MQNAMLSSTTAIRMTGVATNALVALVCQVDIATSPVFFKAWRVNVGRWPAYLLDTNLLQNEQHYRDLTLRVYGGDSTTRIMQEIVLGIGGSATTDGGAGMAAALGARLLDREGAELPPGGAALLRLAGIDRSGLDPRLRRTRVTVACDVDNPLVGPEGAAAIYGPQKGAGPDDVLLLDSALRRYARVLADDLGLDLAGTPGAGAAGVLKSPRPPSRCPSRRTAPSSGCSPPPCPAPGTGSAHPHARGGGSTRTRPGSAACRDSARAPPRAAVTRYNLDGSNPDQSFISGAGDPEVSLRERQSDAHAVPYDRYAVGIHHVAFVADERGQVDAVVDTVEDGASTVYVERAEEQLGETG
jgi:hypothetical protein